LKIIPLFFLITIVLIALIIGDYVRTSKLINANENLQIDLIENTLTSDLIEISPDLQILIQSDNFQEYLLKPEVDTKRKLENTFSLFSKHKRIYAQIRFIDNNGQEKVRVDFVNNKTIRIPEEQLQNKASRYYFKESIHLERGDVFVSPLDLNMELGKIEIPYKPVIRFSTPVFDRHGQKRGILILNYLDQRMLNHFEQLLEGTWGHIEFLNQDGYWIHSHIIERNWGFMTKKDFRFQNIHNTVWPLTDPLI